MSVVDWGPGNDTPAARACKAINLADKVLNRHPTALEPDLPQPPMLGQQEEAPVANAETRKPLFDPTINLGHVLTALAMLAGGAAGWNALDRRLSLVEQQQAITTQQATERVQEQKDSIREIRQDVKDVQRTVNELARVVTGPPARRDRQ